MTDENPFELDDENETGADASAGSDSASMKELRDAYKRIEKENKAFKADQAKREADSRNALVASTFKEVGLNEKHATLFAKVNPEVEVTADAVKAFAAEYDLTTSDGGTVDAPAPVDAPSGPKPVMTGSAAPDLGTLTPEEAMKLPVEERNKLKEAGRIESLPHNEDGSLAIDWLEGIRP